MEISSLEINWIPLFLYSSLCILPIYLILKIKSRILRFEVILGILAIVSGVVSYRFAKIDDSVTGTITFAIASILLILVISYIEINIAKDLKVRALNPNQEPKNEI